MSGGSLNYLCHKDAAAICDQMGDLRTLLEYLLKVNELTAFEATYEVYKTILDLEDKISDLRGVWRAVEWKLSSDWSTDQTREAIEEWDRSHGRGEPLEDDE